MFVCHQFGQNTLIEAINKFREKIVKVFLRTAATQIQITVFKNSSLLLVVNFLLINLFIGEFEIGSLMQTESALCSKIRRSKFSVGLQILSVN